MYYVRYLNTREESWTYSPEGARLNFTEITLHGPFRTKEDAVDFIKYDAVVSDVIEILEVGA